MMIQVRALRLDHDHATRRQDPLNRRNNHKLSWNIQHSRNILCRVLEFKEDHRLQYSTSVLAHPG